MELEQRLGLLQPPRQASVLLLQCLYLRIDRLGLPASLLRTQAVSPLPTPGHQMRRVQAFLPQQGTELPGARTRIGLAKNLELVGRREAPFRVASRHLGVRDGFALGLPASGEAS